jgi:hypothetical protein
MNPSRKNQVFIIFLLFSLSSCLISFSQVSQKTLIKGLVLDELTGDPLPYVSVFLQGTTVGTTTDLSGKFRIETNEQAGTIVFSFIGYQQEYRSLSDDSEQTFIVNLILSPISIDEVVVKPKRKNYSNKNNPAVDLIENVIRNKDSNRPEGFIYLQYKKYEKVQFALSNVSENFKQGNTFGKFRFVFENMDTTKRVGNSVLPMFIKETISNIYYRKDPKASKEIVLAEKTINLEEYLNNRGTAAYLNYLYQNINIYDNEILFLTNKFLSPIASTAPVFYRFYIIDTLKVADYNCIRLFFEPRNKSDFLFHGNLYISMDSTYAVRKIDLGVNKNINIDWVQDLVITQDFEQTDQKGWLLSKEEISIDFGIVKNTMGLFGQRTLSYKDYKINEPVSDKIFKGPERIERIDSAAEKKEYWDTNRSIPLTKSEKAIYTTIDSLKNIPEFKRRMDILMLLGAGWLDLGKVEIGPVSSFYSYNPIEGSRLRFGGRTTTDFSKKITFDSYVAYGFNDKTIKYNAGVTYSLTSRTIYQFPVKSLKINYMKDTRIPGQEFQMAQGDNIFLSFKRGVNDKLLLNNTLKFEFLNEFENHFSFMPGYSFTRQYPLGNLFYNTDEYGAETNRIESIDISEIYLNLRYAPNETFYQGKLYRTQIPNKYPIMLLKIAGGSEFIYNDYDYLRLQFIVNERFYASILGYADVSFEAGKIFGKVPFPLLFVHRANQTYSYQKSSYNLMNFLEFVSDRYAAVNVNYSFNGFLFNKVPLLKKLKLRELVTFKVIYGRVYDKNNPEYQDDQFTFPTDNNGIPLTYTLEAKPYIEGGIGLSNIFKILRVDLIKRFTYTGNPNVDDFGIRVSFRLDL